MGSNTSGSKPQPDHFFTARKLSYLFLAILVLAIAGFYSSYFQYFPFLSGKISTSVHLHAVFMMLWLLLLISQPILISRGMRELHRKLGRYSWILVLLIFLSTGALIFERYNQDALKGVPFITNIAIRMISVITIISFVAFYVLAIKHKGKLAVHARYLLGTGLTVIPASATRLFYFLNIHNIISEFAALLLINTIVIGLMVKDKRAGVDLEEKPYTVILGFQVLLTAYYCFLMGATAFWG